MASGAIRLLAKKALTGPKSLIPNYSQILQLSTQSQPEIKIDKEVSVLNPLQHPDFFGVHELFTVEDLFNARVHFGHKIGSLDDRMKPYIFGSRLGHLIFDLDKTAELLREALNFAAHIAFRDGLILFICRHPQVTHLVEKTAKECNEFSHTRYWSPSTFTNSTIKFKAVTRLPDLCIFLNTLNDVMNESSAVRDAAKMCIPSIAILDTNCNPNLVTFPVPGNDDSPTAIELYCKLMKEAILRGKSARRKISNFIE